MTTVTTSQIEKILISDIDRFSDQIAVYFEDIKPGWGKLTITCCGDSWSSTWNAMGKDRTIRQFFIDCDKYYLGDNLYGGKRSVIDWLNVGDYIRSEARSSRYEGAISKDDARRIYDFAGDVEESCSDAAWIHNNTPQAIWDIWPDFGCDFPTKLHHGLAYTHRIIVHVQTALKESNNAE